MVDGGLRQIVRVDVVYLGVAIFLPWHIWGLVRSKQVEDLVQMDVLHQRDTLATETMTQFSADC